MYTNTQITLYRLIMGEYERVVLDAFYNENKISNFEKTGLTTADTAKVFIPYNGERLNFTLSKDLVVNGACSLEIDNSTQQSFSASMQALKEYGIKTIMSADAKFFGSVDMWHYKLSCK